MSASIPDDVKKFEGAVKAIEAAKPNPFTEVVKRMPELIQAYGNHLEKMDGCRLDLSKWLNGFKFLVRPLIPGDFMVVEADTGQGKTALLQSIAYIAAHPLPTLFFEIELSDDLMCERMLSMHSAIKAEDVERSIRNKEPQDLKGKFDHIGFVTLSNVTTETIRKIVLAQNARDGAEPVAVVIVDYIGLIKGEGKSRYERFSNIAEDLKILAKELNVVMVAASQVHRPEGNDNAVKPSLHSAKDSGSIENSAGLLLGVWREGETGTEMKIKILKNTRGVAGNIIDADFDGATMRVRDQHWLPKGEPRKSTFL
jgi:replicative DNA helicase